MMHTYDEFALRILLEDLPHRHRAAFAAACAQRQLENYEAFAIEVRWGDPAMLAQALDRAWQLLRGQEPIDAQELSRLAAACEALAPDAHKFRNRWTVWAVDAAASAAYALRCLLDDDPQLAVWASGCAYAAVHGYVVAERDLDLNDPSAREQVREHPLVQEELRRQDEDLTMLQGAKMLTSSVLATLRERSRTGGLRPISRRLAGK
jgi:uncharacterized protein